MALVPDGLVLLLEMLKYGQMRARIGELREIAIAYLPCAVPINWMRLRRVRQQSYHERPLRKRACYSLAWQGVVPNARPVGRPCGRADRP